MNPLVIKNQIEELGKRYHYSSVKADDIKDLELRRDYHIIGEKIRDQSEEVLIEILRVCESSFDLLSRCWMQYRWSLLQFIENQTEEMSMISVR